MLRSIFSKCRERARLPVAAIVLAAGVIGLVSPQTGNALPHQERPDWMVGVGMGYGRGTFETPASRRESYQNGAVPTLHFGRMLGQHFMVGVSYEGWMLELGGVVADSVAVKFRRSLQSFGVAVTVFPGSPKNATGGIYLRAAAGTGWAGTAALVVHAGEAQHNSPRIDEWGLGTSASAGYEFWIGRNFTAGLGAGFDYFDIDERIVGRGGFTALLCNLNLYF